MTVETATRPAVAEPTTPIRPSEALRLGRLLRPRQVFGPMFDGSDGSCAVGAMYDGGVHFADWPDTVTCPEQVQVRRWFRWRTSPCHVFGSGSTFSVISVHLNDDHRWPTERIALWLESLGL